MSSEEEQIKNALSELRNFDKEIRRRAVVKLGMIKSERVISILIVTLTNHNEDLIVRARAALMLGKLGNQRAVDPLIRVLEDQGFQIRSNAAEALGKLGNQCAIAPLIVALGNKPGEEFEKKAKEALKKLGCQEFAENQNV